MNDKIDYKKAGVDISAGEKAVELIKPLAKSTFSRNVVTDIGSFGALFKLDLTKWKQPILVSSTDSVGSKVQVANLAQKWDTVGQDIVNHCVNDILTQGAYPLFFLDYIGIGKVVPEHVEDIVKGIALACRENDCSLIGGELAEMPSLYQKDDFDLVGTIVGCVDEKNAISGKTISDGDVLLGFSSTGLHTNGYSLARKIMFDILNLKPDSYINELGKPVAEALLAVHRSYYPILKPFIDEHIIKGLAHITGGGIPGNLKRIIPKGMSAIVTKNSWEVPALFRFLQQGEQVEEAEMYRTFNMGIGMIAVVNEENVNQILKKTDAKVIGTIIKGKQKVVLQ
ncbi:MAG: phosphoribosylformylglycinamidine cyclo-ligase [Candidatus Cloacimonetes bacterium]|nr:phosphoribosylformylglycinamidine cyclo-ligase [Candidatus Cloacimonadota bacterium]